MSIFSYDQLPAKLVTAEPALDLDLIVTIPVLAEPNLVKGLDSLAKCISDRSFEVIVLINNSDQHSNELNVANEKCYQDVVKWKQKNESKSLTCHPIWIRNIPNKIAGVGLARKLAMDEAYQRLQMINHLKGVITCFDGDCLCDANYVDTVIKYFQVSPEKNGASIHFEHPLEDEYSDQIVEYESHLRYYILMQKYLNLPFAFQTVGSAFAVRGSAYKSVGGMNTRKAGEDFYFIHKLVKYGGYGEISTTRIIPSARSSDRVPFGTGKAIAELLKNKNEQRTYHPLNLMSMQNLDRLIQHWYHSKTVSREDTVLNEYSSFQQYLNEINGYEPIQRIVNNCKTLKTFQKRFYEWFDAFRLMKFLHFNRQHFEDVPVSEAIDWYFENILDRASKMSLQQKLITLREISIATSEGQAGSPVLE